MFIIILNLLIEKKTMYIYFKFLFNFHVVSPKMNKDILSNNIIETKPIEKKSNIEIKPSRTVITNEKRPSDKKPSTIVQIKTQAEPASTTKIEVKSVVTKVNIVEENPSSAVPHPPLPVSKVQVSTSSTNAKK